MIQFGLGLTVGAIGACLLFLWLLANRNWRYSVLSGARIPWSAIVGMRLRGTPPDVIVDSYVALVKRGWSVDWQMVEAVYLAGRGTDEERIPLATRVQRVLEKNAKRPS
ncbi:MAG TPA: flotillin-like FloA family protein [Gemmatimonadales bacterium]|nr:flotillin-like FloA family protein [Gemmatimonadales bacterium]